MSDGAIDNRDTSLRRGIRVLLDKAGIPVNLRGYEFLLTSVEIVGGLYRYEMVELVGYLYPTVAAKYGTKTACVERSMRFAINAAWEQNRERLESLLSLSRKPTTGEFIMKLANLAKRGQ